MSEETEDITLSWWARIFRSKAKLTYWLNDDAYTADVTDFKEVSPDCIVYKDYYTLKKIKVKYNCTIIYILEEIK
jgi:hypothetical protein